MEGNILQDSQGRLMNAFRPNLDEALKSKNVRLWRNKTMSSFCYRYFTTSRDQQIQFLLDRETGCSNNPNKSYHVYVDEDCRELPNMITVGNRENVYDNMVIHIKKSREL